MTPHTDNFGIPYFSTDQLIELIYQGNIDKCHDILCENNEDLSKFNEEMSFLDKKTLQLYKKIPIKQTEFDKICQAEWFMPNDYVNINIKSWITNILMNKLKIDNLNNLEKTAEYQRSMEELQEFKKRNLETLLKYLIFLVDTMREHNILWGVGRGSSVASYVLFLIGVHRIDPIKYNLCWKEFLK